METTLIAEALKVWGVPGGVVLYVLIMSYRQLASNDKGGSSALQDIREIKDHLYDLRGRVSKIEGYLEGRK